MSGVGEDRAQTQQRIRITANWRLLERRLAIVRVRANQKSRMRCLTVPVSSTPSNLVESDGGNHFHHPLDSAGNARSAGTLVAKAQIRQTVSEAICRDERFNRNAIGVRGSRFAFTPTPMALRLNMAATAIAATLSRPCRAASSNTRTSAVAVA